MIKVVQSVLKRPERAFPSFYSNKGKIGWGGRIRTFTVLINSEVSYQLDHAPTRCKLRRLATYDATLEAAFFLYFSL